ncbi:MAG: DDE-type integrase/transposase/recombinase [Nitrospira sp.]|nr:DDE-type integrase/transposase/recombinase [Nitrospira sp.]
MADLIVERKDKRLVIKTQGGNFQLPDTWENEKVMLIFLRLWQQPFGGAVYTFQEIADAFGYKDRRDVNNYWRGFWGSGGEFIKYLLRKKKVDSEVVQAVEVEVKRYPWRRSKELLEGVNKRLGREDLTVCNVEAALDQIPCRVIRAEVIRKWEEGRFHPKEEQILEEVLKALEAGDGVERQRGVELLKGVGVEMKHEEVEEVVNKEPREAVEELLEVDKPVESLTEKTRQMVWAMDLYYWNVPLSRIGMWLGRSKSTVYGWVIGLAVVLWGVVGEWVRQKVEGKHLQVDEKWLRIKKRWHYWFVGLDEDTGIPILEELLRSRTKWACRWFMGKLKRLGKDPSRIHTDGLAGYKSAIQGVFALAKHVGCLFHHQQGVDRCVREQLGGLEEEEKEAVRKKMKRVVQTEDTRTVKRRLLKLEQEDREKGWGIGSWIASTWKNLEGLIPALRANGYARTTNQIEGFFRVFQRFYKTRGGFHSVMSAKRELMLFMVVYLFTRQLETGKAPIERIVPEANRMPLYRLLNDPFGSGLATAWGSMAKLEDYRDVKKSEKMATKPLKKAA